MITLYLRYTLDPHKLKHFETYAANEQIPIRESGGEIVGYFRPTDFAGATNEAHALIDFKSLADYEIYRAKLAEHPQHKKNIAAVEKESAILSIQRSLIQRVRAAEEPSE